MALSQALQQKQLIKLLPQQIQLMKLLQVPTALLDERIKEELEENPALEITDEDSASDFETEGQEELSDFETAADADDSFEDYDDDYSQGEDSVYDDSVDTIDLSSYDAGDDDIADYKLQDNNYPDASEHQDTIYKASGNFHDVLMEQLNMLSLEKSEHIVAEQIIGSIDEDGYLRREIEALVDDLAFRQNIITTEQEVERLIGLIQNFEPAGVCARSLQECLLLQLKTQKAEGRDVDLAIKVMDRYFEEFTKKHYDKIQKGLAINEDDLRDVINIIIKLNPKPGLSYGGSTQAESYVIPDFFINNNNGKLELSLNSRNAPDLRISSDYKEMLREYDRGTKKDKQQKETVMFIKQKIDSAKWFIDIIKQRHDTLFNTMYAIMTFQYEFFLTGDETNLKPMILKDVAEKTNLDISTISRVANSKFVQTEFGTFRLKFFFSESLSTESGEEVSTREVKRILSDIVEGEDKQKPLSDDILTDMLNEKGYNIARRTVAKYREQLNIPVARLRKQL